MLVIVNMMIVMIIIIIIIQFFTKFFRIQYSTSTLQISLSLLNVSILFIIVFLNETTIPQGKITFSSSQVKW
jgi:hypothetical protein